MLTAESDDSLLTAESGEDTSPGSPEPETTQLDQIAT